MNSQDILTYGRVSDTVLLFVPQNDAARSHMEATTDGQWWADGLVVEHRYIVEFAEAMRRDGFSVAWGQGRGDK